MHVWPTRRALSPSALACLAVILAGASLLALAAGGCGSTTGPPPTPSPSTTPSTVTAPSPFATPTKAAGAGGVAAGLCDQRLDSAWLTGSDPAAAVREDTRELHAAWIRLDVLWSTLEPDPGTYDQERLAALDGFVDLIHGAGAKVLLTVREVPEWASDSSFWGDPPPGRPPGYDPSYPMTQAALPRFGEFAEFLARRYAGRVQALECWNEPNLWLFLYPQRTKEDPDFAARTYLRMLEAFSAGVRRAGGGALVVGGAAASHGTDTAFGTSPLRFASYLARHGAASLLDVYSHHAYTPGATVHQAPGDVPDRPATTVTLGNLDSLLRLFPRKPFYITEYGYSTQPSVAFGWFAVSEPLQARYLRRAYAVAARYPRVKLLVWYLVVDQVAPGRPADTGVYTGLRRADGTRKPSWYAFAQVGAAAE